VSRAKTSPRVQRWTQRTRRARRKWRKWRNDSFYLCVLTVASAAFVAYSLAFAGYVACVVLDENFALFTAARTSVRCRRWNTNFVSGCKSNGYMPDGGADRVVRSLASEIFSRRGAKDRLCIGRDGMGQGRGARRQLASILLSGSGAKTDGRWRVRPTCRKLTSSSQSVSLYAI